MSAAAPVRRPAQLRGATALHLPDVLVPGRSAPTHKALPRPRLVLVSAQRTTVSRLPFLIVLGTVLAGGLVAVLLLHMVAAQDAFRVTGLQQRLATLTDQEQQAEQVVAADSSPAALQARAVALGMEPTAITKFHRRADGRAIGVQTPFYVPPPVTAAKPAKSTKATKTTKATKATKATKTTKTATKSATSATGKQQGKHQPKHKPASPPKSGHTKP
jgi:hypothetical protein